MQMLAGITTIATNRAMIVIIAINTTTTDDLIISMTITSCGSSVWETKVASLGC